MLLRVKDERNKRYLEMHQFAPATDVYPVRAPHCRLYHWALDPQPGTGELAAIQERAWSNLQRFFSPYVHLWPCSGMAWPRRSPAAEAL